MNSEEIQIVINIPKKLYNRMRNYHGLDDTYMAVKRGTPLPKGHGDLIDRGELKTHFVGTEQGTDLEVYLESTIIDAHVIIPADKESEEKDDL